MADQATSKRSPALPSATVPVKACLYMRAKCFQAAVGFLSRILTVGLKAAKQFPATLITVDQAGDFKFACLDSDGQNRFQLTVAADGSSVLMGLGGNPPNVLLSAINGEGEIVSNPISKR